MRIWVLVAFVVLLAAVLFRGWRTGRRQVWLVCVLTVSLACLGWFEWRWQQLEASAEAGIAVVAGNDSPGIRCQRMSETLFYARGAIGFVGVDADGNAEEAVLTYDVCSALRSWLNSDKRSPSRDEVVAVHVVSHEAAHLAGEFNESKAECIAMKHDVDVAIAMGATREQAEALAEFYRVEIYPTLPREYRGSVGC